MFARRDFGGGNIECGAEGEGTQPKKKITGATGRIIQVVNISLKRTLKKCSGTVYLQELLKGAFLIHYKCDNQLKKLTMSGDIFHRCEKCILP